MQNLDVKITHICDDCHLDKKTRNFFPVKVIVSIINPLQLLHMNLFGPTRNDSSDGKMYDFVIIDD